MTLLDNTKPMTDTLLDEARDAFQAGRLDQAEQAARSVLDADPASVDALNVLGNVAVRRKNPLEAARLFAAASERDDTPKSRLNHALALDMAGARREAVVLYRAVLDRFPDHPTARQRLVKALFALGDAKGVTAAVDAAPGESRLDAEASYLLAVCCFQAGQKARADAFLEHALALNPAYLPAGLMKAGRLIVNHRHAEALDILQPLQEQAPDHAELQMLLGKVYKALHRDDDALRHFRKVADRAEMQPKQRTEAAAEAGRILQAESRHEEAVEQLRPLHRADPANVPVAERLIKSLLALDRKAEVVEVARATLDTHPPHIGAWNSLAIHIKSAGEKDLAVRYLRMAMLREPSNPFLHYNAGFTLNELFRAEEGETLLRRALRIKPDYPKAWNALSVSLSIQFRAEEAEQAARRSLKLDGKSRSAWLNLGITLRGQGRFSDAVRTLRQACAMDPKYAEANHNLGITLMMAGEIREGFQLYDWRFALPDFPSPKRAFRQREWTGQDLANSGILVYMEQGMGDEIMFAWYLHHVRRRARHLTVDCDKRLVPLFARSFPGATVVGRDPVADPRTADPALAYKIPAGHLPKFFWAETREHIFQTCHLANRRYVRTPGYLKVDPDRQAHWRRWLGERAEGRPLVGISWRSALHTRMRDLQYLAPEEIARTFGPDVAVVNLQYSTAPEELDAFRALSDEHGFRFIHPEGVDLKDDLDDVMALISTLDLIVSPLISVAWMGGALGVPTWVFRTSEVSRMWQQLGMPYVPWCPSMRLFFRHPLVPWEGPISTVRSELQGWLASR